MRLVHFLWILKVFISLNILCEGVTETKKAVTGNADSTQKGIELQFCGGYENITRESVYTQFISDLKSLHFRWKKIQALSCISGNISKFSVKLLSDEDSKNFTFTNTSRNLNETIKADGRLEIEQGIFSADKYCINYLNGTEVRGQVCSEEQDDNNHNNNTWGRNAGSPCIRKCCPLGSNWDITIGECKPVNLVGTTSDGIWKPRFYNLSDDSDCVSRIQSDEIDYENLLSHVGLPSDCLEGDDRNTIPARNIPPDFALGRFRMLLNGSVLINFDNGTWKSLPLGTFCVDEITTRTRISTNTNSSLTKMNFTPVLLVCKNQYKIKEVKRSIPLKYASMLFAAALILLVTAIVYLFLWDRHNIYEWTVFFEVISMLFMIIFVAVAHTTARDPAQGYLGTKKCIFLGIVSHYFFLATFFWLFVINFEIWWNFRTLTIRNKKSRKWLRLFNYQLLAWGCPAIIVTVGLLLDRKYGLQNDEIDCTSIIVPNYGQLNCYISKRAQGPLLYFPIGVLLGCNLLFYTLTVFKMCEYRKISQVMAQSKTNGQFQPIVVFARLFIVMGVSWIFEIVSWAVSTPTKGIIPLYWVVFDIVTLLQAIAIFVIFICRREISTKLIEKYPSLKRLKAPCCNPQDRSPTQAPSVIAGVTSRSIRFQTDLNEKIPEISTNV